MKQSLYQWQKECINLWLNNKGRGIVKVVTGAGKTRMALDATKELIATSSTHVKVKIVVPKTFMIGQWTSFILENFMEDGISREDIGCYYGLHKDTPDRPFMIYVINSARFALARHILSDFDNDNSVLVIADECHHYASEENKRIFDFLPKLSAENLKDYYSLGLSATPHTEGFVETLEPALGPLIFTYGFSEAIESNVINNCVLYNIALRFSASEMVEYADLSHKIIQSLSRGSKYTHHTLKVQRQDFFHMLKRLANDKNPAISRWAIGLLGLLYKRRSLISEASVRVECAFVLISRLDPHSNIIVFGERISQSDLLFEHLNKMYPNQVARYHSAMGFVAKKQAIARFRDRQVRILVCCKALDEGFNIPSADVGIVLSSTSAERQRIQRLGRILRSSNSKALSNLYYFYIGGTLEEKTLLVHPVVEMKEFTLHYMETEKNFGHERYDEVAYRVIEKQKDPSVIATMRYFLELGQLRSDWLIDEIAIQEKVNQATEKVSRNYWLCMLQMAKIRNTESKG